MNLIAGELALDFAAGCFAPDTLVHTPGLTNVIPDHLSRMGMPGEHEYKKIPQPPDRKECIVRPRISLFFCFNNDLL